MHSYNKINFNTQNHLQNSPIAESFKMDSYSKITFYDFMYIKINDNTYNILILSVILVIMLDHAMHFYSKLTLAFMFDTLKITFLPYFQGITQVDC